MKNETPMIQNVSDTALWVAYYRSRETDRPNPLFKDPMAKILIGERGQQIAQHFNETTAHTEFNVLIRTVIIDRYIQSLVEKGADCLVNLGAGLDTRPYRLNLPSSLKWIEVDFPHMIQLKDEKLSNEKPNCQLQRISLDLSDRAKRQQMLNQIGKEFKKIVVLTEGVLPYLTQDQVSELAEDLLAESNIKNWIADYISPVVYKYLQESKRAAKMKNAPFQFYPADWFGFFSSLGWDVDTIQYLPEEGQKLGRSMPAPLIAKLIGPFLSKATKEKFMRTSGYMIMKRK